MSDGAVVDTGFLRNKHGAGQRDAVKDDFKPAFFRRRSPAREPRAAAEATDPPLGAKGPGGQ